MCYYAHNTTLDATETHKVALVFAALHAVYSLNGDLWLEHEYLYDEVRACLAHASHMDVRCRASLAASPACRRT